MENKYLEKIASQNGLDNKYLEKIAGWVSNAIGGIKTIAGGGAKGSVFNAADQMVGKGIRTVQRATQSTNRLSDFAAKRNAIKAARTSAGVEGTAGTRAITDKYRQENNFVKKGPTHIQTTTPTGEVTNRFQNSGYHTGTTVKGTDSDPLSKAMANIRGKENIKINKIHTARAKLAIGAAGVAGVGALGYHMANKNSQPQYQDYGTMPY